MSDPHQTPLQEAISFLTIAAILVAVGCYVAAITPGGQIVDNLLIPLARDWDGFSAAAHEFIASGERVVSLGTYAATFKTTGRHMNTPYAHVWTVRNGRITRFDQFVDTLKVQEAMA
jgi:ketosteroid isomerase-like protein